MLGRLKRYSGSLATCSIVWHELCFGVSRLAPGRRRSGLEACLRGLSESDLDILEYDQSAAQWHATVRAELSACGVSSPFANGQIAAIAATRGLVLVTRNVKDFGHFSGIEVENWWE